MREMQERIHVSLFDRGHESKYWELKMREKEERVYLSWSFSPLKREGGLMREEGEDEGIVQLWREGGW